MASRGSDLINKRERDEIQKDYLKAQGPLCYFKLNPSWTTIKKNWEQLRSSDDLVKIGIYKKH